MRLWKKSVAIILILCFVAVTAAYAVPYAVRTLYQRWDRIESEDTRIQLIDMYCNFTGELTFTYQLTFNNTDTNPHSATIEFIIYDMAGTELYRGTALTVDLAGADTDLIEFDVELLSQEDISHHDHFKIGITEGLE